jgi:short chain dehydrogenase
MMRPTPARGRPDPSNRAAADRGVSRAQVACTTVTQGRITSPFTARSTAAEVVAGIDLRDKRAIVTGGSSGIGIETARALASAGADLTLAVRNPTPELASAP